jgi:tetraprenyl-beta-curcumene synthase
MLTAVAAVSDPVPLCAAQLVALALATTRELVWGRRAVSREIRGWRARAARIVDDTLREDALTALTCKRGATDGAALFWTLLPHRDLRVLRLLVAHELIWDYLDCVSERSAEEANGVQLHRAIVESLDPTLPLSDYYLHHPWRRDGGFLVALVETCRSLCRSLPSYDVVRPLVVREAGRATVQGLNHILDPRRRDRALRTWAAMEYPTERRMAWFELTGAASSALAIHALLTLAGESRCSGKEVADVYAAYFPWAALTTVMLDSYVDQHEDVVNGAYSYLAHYTSHDVALSRLHECVGRAARGVHGLPNGHRHAVVIDCMLALYLSNDRARSVDLRASTRSLAEAGGSLTRLLLPILRLWRIRYAQQAA